MVRDIYDPREYLRKELEEIEDEGTLHSMYCAVLRNKGIRYGAVREARLRQNARQITIFNYQRDATYGKR